MYNKYKSCTYNDSSMKYSILIQLKDLQRLLSYNIQKTEIKASLTIFNNKHSTIDNTIGDKLFSKEEFIIFPIKHHISFITQNIQSLRIDSYSINLTAIINITSAQIIDLLHTTDIVSFVLL